MIGSARTMSTAFGRRWVLPLACAAMFVFEVSSVRAAERIVPTGDAELQLSYAPLVR